MEEKHELKVCQVCAEGFTVDKFLKPLIFEMTRIGWNVTTVCSDGVSITKLRNEGLRINTIKIERSKSLIKAIFAVARMYKYFKSQKFDVVHVHTPIAAFLARISLMFVPNTFVIYTAHGFYFHENMNWFKRNIFFTLEKIAFLKTHLLFCQSSEDSAYAISSGLMKESRTFTIGNGVDLSVFGKQVSDKEIINIKTSIGVPANGKIVGIVARRVSEKGYFEFLESALRLHTFFPDVYFVLVGGRLTNEHDEGVDDLILRAKRILGNNLVSLGFRNDVSSLISCFDIFCLPSYREGMPRSIIEAMFRKKPVVASDIRGSREEVINGSTGLLFPVHNVAELTKALDYLLRNPEKAVRMGENGYRYAKLHFDERKVLSLQIDLIKKFLNYQ